MNFLKTFLAGLLAFVVGNVVVFFLMIIMLIAGIAGSMEREPVYVYRNSVLEINLAESIIDAPSTDPFASFDFNTLEPKRQSTLLATLQAIDAARTDDRIKGIYLRLNGGGGIAGSAIMEEFRAALAAFRESDKFIVSYNETYSQGRYYLASVADSIFMQPEGGIDWTGMAVNTMFYKGLLDKLDLRAEVFRPTVCTFKSAVEPYILTKMSDDNRRQMQALVDSIWGTISDAVAEARGIDPERLREITDNLEVVLPEDALRLGFVDGLCYEDEMKEKLVALCGTEDYHTISLGDYAAQVTAGGGSSDAEVAIVYADGQIVDGKGTDQVYGNTLAATLADVRTDAKVKAVVLRVNSPGGSALASDLIWREMELLRAEKPVIVSMGSYAASGGYYISCPADAIVADRMTLTGSIGVFGMYLYTADALKNKLGVTIDGVKSNRSAGMGAAAPLTALERASIMRGVDKVYGAFTSKVAAGRNLPVERVLEIAGGRVWSGSDALEIGLVDAIGGLKEAIAVAVEKAGLDENHRVVEWIDEPTGFAAILSSLNAHVRASIKSSGLESVMKEYAAVREAFTQQGILMYDPYRIELE